MLTQQDFQRVLSTTRQFLNPTYDHEQLALDILIVSWENGVAHPSRQFIRQKCFDAIRAVAREQRHLALYATEPRPESHRAGPEITDMIDKLTAVLDQEEKKIIWYRFYWDLSVLEISKRLRISKTSVQETLTTAIHKMKMEAIGE